MKIQHITIDEVTWQQASATRRDEWQSHIHDLTQNDDLEGSGYELRIRVTSYELDLDFIRSKTESAFQTTLQREHFDTVIDEYIDTMKQISEAQTDGNLDRVEALDMAKKVTHDRASRLLRRQLSDVEIDHETGRQLFTLFFALWVDTSSIVLKHPRPKS